MPHIWNASEIRKSKENNVASRLSNNLQYIVLNAAEKSLAMDQMMVTQWDFLNKQQGFILIIICFIFLINFFLENIALFTELSFQWLRHVGTQAAV